MTVTRQHTLLGNSIWRLLQLVALALALVFSIAATSEAAPDQRSAFCATAATASFVETAIPVRINTPENDATDDLCLNCCNCLACGAVLENNNGVIKTYLQKTRNLTWAPVFSLPRDGPHGPFRPPRI